MINGVNLFAGASSVTVPSTSGLTAGTPVSGFGVLPGTTVVSINGTNKLTLSSAPTRTVLGTSLTVAAVLAPPVVPQSFATNVFADLSLLNGGTSAVTVDLNPLVGGSVAAISGRSWGFAANQTGSNGTQGLELTQNGSLSVSSATPAGVQDFQVELSVEGTLVATGTVTLNAAYPSLNYLSGTVGSPAQTVNLAEIFPYLVTGPRRAGA